MTSVNRQSLAFAGLTSSLEPVGGRPQGHVVVRGLRRALVLVLAFSIGCTATWRPIPVDTGVNFAAHVEHRGIVVDKMQGGAPAMLEPAGWQSFWGGPRFLLEAHDTTVAALWFPESSHVIVRASADPQSPVLGKVDATWRQSAIRLTFRLPDGSFQTGEFARIDGGHPTATLGPQVSTLLDIEGVYRAELRDAHGAAVGWLRVRINCNGAPTRIYDGILPPSLSGPLGAAAVALLDSDVSYVADHAQDPDQGN